MKREGPPRACLPAETKKLPELTWEVLGGSWEARAGHRECFFSNGSDIPAIPTMGQGVLSREHTLPSLSSWGWQFCEQGPRTMEECAGLPGSRLTCTIVIEQELSVTEDL